MNCRRAALITALLVPAVSHAQRLTPGGPYAPIVLLLPSGARTLAMGNTGVAGRDDDVVFFNPAQLAIARGFSASLEAYSPDAAGGSMSSVTRFSTGGIGLGMSMLNYQLPANIFPGDRATSLGDGPEQGTSIEAVLGIGQVVKGLRVGGAIKYAEDAATSFRVERLALDLGVSKDFLRFYTVGLAVQNIGRSMSIGCSFQPLSLTNCAPPTGVGICCGQTSANLPFRTTLGVSTSRQVGELDLVGTAAVSMLRHNWVSPSGGVELGYSWLDGYSVAFRGGARRSLPGERPWTGGLGFTVDRLSIDYAFETLTELRLVGSTSAIQSVSRTGHRVGLRIR